MASTNLATGLIDTDVLIDAERAHQVAMRFIGNQKAAGGLRISIVSAMELLVGCRNATELRNVRQFLSQAAVIPIVVPISQRAINLIETFSLSHGLLIPDALIAATALEQGWPLYTKNIKHFQMIPGLTVIRPYA